MPRKEKERNKKKKTNTEKDKHVKYNNNTVNTKINIKKIVTIKLWQSMTLKYISLFNIYIILNVSL